MQSGRSGMCWIEPLDRLDIRHNLRDIGSAGDYLQLYRGGCAAAGQHQAGVMHFLIQVIIGWLALFPRSREELDDLSRGHPLAQRFFGGRPGGFFGDYRRRMTSPGNLILYGSIGLTALLMLPGAVRIELAIIGIDRKSTRLNSSH